MAGYSDSVSGYHEFRRIQPHEGAPHGGDDNRRKGNPPAPLRQGKPGSAVFQRESAARGGEQDILRRGWDVCRRERAVWCRDQKENPETLRLAEG
ncbi:MAG TPA: hypothetical protein H9744_05065 [Candidatus Eisenbergiella stercoravium]|nr:hypothetical protein [Candidatus Eisenbergiella stercoravium]